MDLIENQVDELVDMLDSLEHYGVKGMKWGVRKEEERTGQRRYGSLDYQVTQNGGAVKKSTGFANRRTQKKAQKAIKKSRQEKARLKKEEQSKEKTTEEQKEEYLKKPRSVRKHYDMFTPEEINAAMRHFEIDKRLAEFDRDKLRRGAEYLEAINRVTRASIGTWNIIAQVFNSFGASLPPLMTDSQFAKSTSKMFDEKEKKKKEAEKKRKETAEKIKKTVDEFNIYADNSEEEKKKKN